MKKIFTTSGIILASVLASLVVLWLIYNFLPLSVLDAISIHRPQKFGSTITTILGTDRLTDSRTTINTNFANLNTDKAENTVTTLANLTSAASLSTIGTIVSGIWNATAIPVLYGGTGTTSPTSNQVMLGNGASGLKVVNGLGTSGQFLTSNGVGQAPSFQSASVDQTQNYTWTGYHVFTGGVVINNASSTVAGNITVTNNVTVGGNLVFASSTAVNTLFQSSQSGSSQNTSTTTLVTYTIPANTLASPSRSLRITGFWQRPQGSTGCFGDIEYGTGTATSTIAYGEVPNQGGPSIPFMIVTYIYVQTSAAQFTASLVQASPSSVLTPIIQGASTTVNSFNKSYIGFAEATKTAAACSFIGGSVEILSD